MEAKVSPKRRDNSPTPGGDILEDIIDISSVFYNKHILLIGKFHITCPGYIITKRDVVKAHDGTYLQ
jgi:hypothetical protein